MRLAPTLRALLASAASLTLLPGCSLFFVQSPPTPRLPDQPVACTTSNAAPIVDSVVAGLQLVRVGYAISQKESDYEDFPISRGADIGIGVGLLAVFAASAAYGFGVTGSCASAQHEAAAEQPVVDAVGTPAGGGGVQTQSGGCTYDAQCAGEERCVEGTCSAGR